MAQHNQLGQKGEALAATYLEQQGFSILHRNWRHSHYEIDIIAIRNSVLHFIEVKVRSSSRFGHPEDSVTKKKFQSILNAADEFLYQNPQYKHVQYDILSILLPTKQQPDYLLIEDVYL